ncbi:MAG: ABC transporter ATP-binding protein [Pseudomonadota bacterium]|nr:ABC transporter ATP-binding protein [Pseudomonadota bacterium]
MSTQRTVQEKELREQKDLHILQRFLPLLRAQFMPLLLSVLLMLFLAGLDLAVPWVTKMAVDRYIVPSHSQESPLSRQISRPDAETQTVQPRLAGALRAGFLLMILALARFAFSLIQVLIMELAGQRMMHDLRLKIYAHIQSLPIAYFSRNPVGRLVTRVTNDIQNMQEMFTTIITFALRDVLTIIGIIIILLVMDPALALILFLIGPLLAFTVRIFSRKSRDVFRRLRVQTAEINSRFSEAVSGIKEIQLFTREKDVIDDFKNLNHENFLAGLHQIKLFGLFMPLLDILSSTALALIIYYGGSRVLSQSMTLGTLIAFISYSKMFFRPLRDIAEKHNILQNSLSSGERLAEILDQQPEAADEGSDITRIETLTFANVAFSYLPDEPLLRGISFTLQRGQTLAIVGPTGSGKTSLINLIARFYEPQEGQISVNGIPLTQINPLALRRHMAVVSQDPYLFSGTLRENILPPDCEKIDSEEMQNIIRQAHLGEVVSRLPQGLDTRVSQGGASLSSGERQLVSIARALAHQPDLIIFDEATSYVDTEAEEKIRQAIAALKENRASITIAHRLRSAMTADHILVLIDGRITEAGNHAELMARKGFYYRSVQKS